MCSLVEYDTILIRDLERAPIMEYYMILNNRVKLAKQTKK